MIRSHVRSLRLTVATMWLGGCASPQARDHASAPVQPSSRAEAIDALQGSDSSRFLSEADIHTMARVLARIRARHPEVRGIKVGNDGSTLHIWMTESAAQILHEQIAGGWVDGGVVVQVTGVHAIDSVSASLGVRTTRVVRMLGRIWTLLPDFPQPVNVERVAALYNSLPDVRSASTGLPRVGGDGGFIWVRRGAAEWRITFQRGWGDCPSGCIHQRRYLFRFVPQIDRITKLGEEGDPRPPDPPPNEALQRTGELWKRPTATIALFGRS